LAHNGLVDISADLSDLVMLEWLDLSNNQLESLPGGIGFLTRLTEFTVHHNKLEVLPNDITNLRSEWHGICLPNHKLNYIFSLLDLHKLDIMNNSIKFLPEYMGDLRKIEFIYAQHNDIDKLPDLDGCEHLQELHISNNFITEIPERFCEKLPSLKVLDLRDNKIEKLPDEISMMQSLMRLDLSNNSIYSLPTSLCTLAHLVSLHVEGNPIRSIRRDVIACGTQRILKTLRDRGGQTLNGNQVRVEQFTTIPEKPLFPDIYQLKKTRSLTLCGKALEEVPEQVFIDAKNAEISVVDFSKNKLRQLPEGLTQMSSMISELSLNSNVLIEVQPFVGQFDHIKYLNLSCNHLDSLPDEVGLMITMREINIANNRFTTFPKCIYDLVHLEIVLACDNKIEELDASENGLAQCKRLATLDLSNNNIKSVPPVLGNMTKITTLLLHGNSFRAPRHQILESGTASIMSYLRDRIPKEF
jgi:Leucine-rich repeat (LRR) protein